MRWREDGGDYYFGSQAWGSGKPGGMVFWRTRGRFAACAWNGVRLQGSREFKTVEAGKRFVERLLRKWGKL